MKNRGIYTDYQNVYKAMANDKQAKDAIEAKYGKIENMSQLYRLGADLYEKLNSTEKESDYLQTKISLDQIDETKKHLRQ